MDYHANVHTKEWLKTTISGLEGLWERATLTVVETKDLPKRTNPLVWIPGTVETDRRPRQHTETRIAVRLRRSLSSLGSRPSMD